jgi:hypothetical protein
MNKHLKDDEQPLTVAITSTDATRHKYEMQMRGDMVIELATELGHWKKQHPSKLIRIAREIVEDRYKQVKGQ